MFLKTLTISTETEVIREINFRNGINLIVDETPLGNDQVTGNSVGKTTVLILIDFCLGGSPKNIYVDPESKKDEYKLVKDFLIQKKVLITLVLKEDLAIHDSKEVVVQRNFLAKREILRKIDGQSFTEDEFEVELLRIFFPNQQASKPTFRQLISHNIRYKDDSINNTLKTLDRFTTDAEYETLYLFLLGCEFTKGNEKHEILSKIKQEDTYKARLEKNQTKTAYEAALSLVNGNIDELNKRKSNFNLNTNFEKDLDKLNGAKYQINKVSSEISKLNIRRDLILESQKELNSDVSKIDLKQLQIIYQQATSQIKGIQKTFDDLVSFHNNMIDEKVKFITKELPELEKRIQTKKEELKKLLSEEKSLSNLLSKSESFEELEKLIGELNENFRQKGEYENIVQQLNEVDSNISQLNKELEEIDTVLFSDSFEAVVKTQLNKFNKFFSSISDTLYGEKYALKYDKVVNKKGQRLYKFSAFNTNFSSGKKQGEISCFDIAYTFFADEENIPCMHFLLNDKKELMHDNQLVKLSQLANVNNIQFVASILKDKLPEELNKPEYFVAKLSQANKLFRIESYLK